MGRSTAAIAAADNLFDFFHQEVDAAKSHRRAPVSEEGVYYLTNLLVERSRAEAEPPANTLVELQIQAAQASGPAAVTALRELGDKALYTSGFFRSSIAHHRAVSLDYYMEMGASAYQRLARALHSRAPADPSGHKPMDAIFGELGRCFRLCSDLLQEVRFSVRAQTDDASDAAVLALYEEWLATGSRAAAERLKALGVVPLRPGSRPIAD